MEFITANLPLILCTLIGFGLLIAEAIMPGFGVAGVSGVILEVIAIFLAWSRYGTGFAICLTLAIIIVVGVTVFLSWRSILRGRLSKSALVLHASENAEAPSAEGLDAFVGKRGTVATPLRPAGLIEVDGQRISAVGGGEFMEKGTNVEVLGVQGDHVTVRAC